MLSKPLICTAFLTLCLYPASHAATYHVAQRNSNASDTGPGSVDKPWKTISQAAAVAKAGDTIEVGDGVYREHVVITNNGTAQAPIRFSAAPGAHVVITGADHLTSWNAAANSPAFTTPWPHRFNTWSKSMTHPGDDRHQLVGRCEQVFADGYLLRQVLQVNHLAPGTFFVDLTNKLLHVWDTAGRNPAKLLLEASARPEILRVQGDFVEVKGFHFRYAANAAQHGAAAFRGKNARVENCVFEQMNSSGAVFAAEDIVVRRCVFRDNGQLGFGANRAHRLLFTDCRVKNNNTKDFSRGWEAGGNKLAFCRGVVIERSQFLRNRGNGIWFDIGNENCTVRNCLIAENEDAGIFYEISYGLKAHDNVIVGNGFASTAGAWGAQSAISLSSSPNCVIERNLMVGNREGFNFREQPRTTPLIDDRKEHPVWNHDQLIRHNIIAFNRVAQVWGWFDIKDGRHWPGARPGEAAPPAGSRPGDIAAPYIARSSDGQPSGLTLEKLRLKFEANIYHAGPGQGGFAWGPTWARHERYSNLQEFQDALWIDQNSRSLDPRFADIAARDFRVDAAMMEELKDCYPRGAVPGVLLGIR